MRFLATAIFCFLSAASAVSAADVSLTQDGAQFKMSNGRLAVTIEKKSGRVSSVTLGNQSLLGQGTGYWSMSASSGRMRVEGFGTSREQAVSIDPSANGGERAEVVCRFRGTGTDLAYPGNTEIRYSIDRESTTL
ncbi:hypothetical protein HQ447_07205, partial [bacterium]|nr:hypothetical protein [bacterium]